MMESARYGNRTRLPLLFAIAMFGSWVAQAQLPARPARAPSSSPRVAPTPPKVASTDPGLRPDYNTPSARSRARGAAEQRAYRNGSVYYGGYAYSSPYYHDSWDESWEDDDNHSDGFSTITPGDDAPSRVKSPPRAYSLRLPPGLVTERPPAKGGIKGQLGEFGEGALAELPEGSEKVLVGEKPVYRAGANWYRPYLLAGDVVYYEVPAPAGARVSSLPGGYALVVTNGMTNAVFEGTYYRPDGDEWEVVEAPHEDGSAASQKADTGKSGEAYVRLKAMSDFLDSASRFSFTAIEMQEDRLETGEAVQTTTWRDVDVRRPDGIRVETKGEAVSRQFWYDGTRATLFDLPNNSFASIGAPPTINELLDLLAQQYALTLPLSDLLFSGLYDRLQPLAVRGEVKGLEEVDAVMCHHLAFTGEWVDWEVWVQAREQTVPRKVAIIYKQFEGAPRYEARLTRWDFAPAWSDEIFAAQLPPEAIEVEALSVRAE